MSKKILKYTMSIIIMFGFVWSMCIGAWKNYGGWNLVLDDEFPFNHPHEVSWCSSANPWDCVDIEHNDSIINKLLDLFWFTSDKFADNHKFLNYAKAILNLALSLVSLIALIMTIYTFYMIFFSEDEAWIKKAKWNLVGIFITLAVIWLAWIIVSFIFRWYKENWKNNETNIQGSISYLNHTIDDVNNEIYFYV